jgi:NDP-4-keto-2,6-dideoxyhexose 3-C-methyltransferase
MPKVWSRCRLCGNPSLVPIVSFGSQPISAVFPRPEDPDPTRSPLDLVLCDGPDTRRICRLLQLRHSADVHEMYGATYGYRSGTSRVMRAHLSGKAAELVHLVRPREGDAVLDIGCNDGTLLNAYRGLGLRRVGIDPSAEKFREHHDPEIEAVYDFFSAERARAVVGDQKFAIVTSIAMLYDLDDPLAFARDVAAVLADDGIWAFEQSDLRLFLENLSYDQTCHEHVTYLALRQIEWILDQTGLRLLDVRWNELNGGSSYVLVGKRKGPHRPDAQRIEEARRLEAPLAGMGPYRRFANRVRMSREEVRNFLRLAREAGRSVYGYGASTKGNITLNWCGITHEDLPAVSDKQVMKHGRVTPGTRLPIVSHEEVRSLRPDYLLVLIWHLRREVIEDEIPYLEQGGRLVFPLPRLHVVDRDNYKHFLESGFDDLAFRL